MERCVRLWETDVYILEEAARPSLHTADSEVAGERAANSADAPDSGRPGRSAGAHDPAAAPAETVLFIHGLGSGARAWRGALPPVAAAGLRAVAADLPGFGDTPPSPRGVLAEGTQAAAYLSDLLAALEIAGPVHLVGWSLGGAMSLHFALQFPDRVASLTLVDAAALGRELGYSLRLLGLPWLGPRLLSAPVPSLPPGDGPVKAPATLAIQPLARPFVEDHLAYLHHPWNAAVVAEMLRRSGVFWRGQGRIDVHRRLAGIAAPTLILWGQNDRITPLRHGKRAARLLPRARLVVYPDCGHCLPAEWPGRFVQDLRAFLAEVRSPAQGPHGPQPAATS